MAEYKHADNGWLAQLLWFVQFCGTQSDNLAIQQRAVYAEVVLWRCMVT